MSQYLKDLTNPLGIIDYEITQPPRAIEYIRSPTEFRTVISKKLPFNIEISCYKNSEIYNLASESLENDTTFELYLHGFVYNVFTIEIESSLWDSDGVHILLQESPKDNTMSIFKKLDGLPLVAYTNEQLLHSLRERAKELNLVITDNSDKYSTRTQEIYGMVSELNDSELVAKFITQSIHIIFELLLRGDEETRQLLLLLLDRIDIDPSIKLLGEYNGTDD